MTLPQLGLALGRRPPWSLEPLLVEASSWCRPLALDPAAGRPAAILATAAAAERLPGTPVLGLWTRAPEEAASPLGCRAAAIVSDERGIVAAAGARGVFAAGELPGRGPRPMPPFVRERLRACRGLPPVALLEQTPVGWRWAGGPEPLDEDLVATAMGCASAVVATEPRRLLEALAWGAPCVTSEEAADEVGAVVPRDLLVGRDGGERLQLATRLAGDPEQSAELSWAGRKLIERWYDAGRAALRLVDLLGLRPEAPESPVALELALLGTPDDGPVVARLIAATAHDPGGR
ncbi:MAG: hypothetical protein JF924_04530 [Candidatus Dormibacteraeota bacterium]|nr:hypothetical protein [Candidatus Dormibacteraeota bacterium]